LLFACADDEGGTAGKFPKKIIPMIEGEHSSSLPGNAAEIDLESYTEQLEIALRPEESLIQVLNTNLDVDTADEQIIVVKDTKREDAPVKIVVADFDFNRNRYIRSWETTLGAVNERTFRLEVKDIVGDHSLQIVASGVNKNGAATLDIFKPLSTTGARLSYIAIFKLESLGNIEIIETERDGAYTSAGRNGASFQIVAYTGNSESEYYTDVIRDTYAYSAGDGKYRLQHSEKIQAEKAGEAQLAALYQSSSPEPFKNFIKGIWYKADETGKGVDKILAFDPENEDIAFYSNGVEEAYKWKFSRRSLYNTLYIYAENALLKSVQPNITVSLHALNELSIAVTEYSTMEQWLNEQWGGKYVRLNKTQNLAREQAGEAPVAISKLLLEGSYTSPNAISLFFKYPAFGWTEGEKLLEGGFAVLEFHNDGSTEYVLSLKIIEEQGLKITDLFYTIDFQETLDPFTPLSAFTLTPAQTTAYGMRESKGQPIVFTRSPAPH
jgi:hypothetical protein